MNNLLKIISCYVLLLAISIHFKTICSQSIIIDSVSFYNLIEIRPSNVITSHFGDGPIINLYFTVQNDNKKDEKTESQNIDILISYKSLSSTKTIPIWTNDIESTPTTKNETVQVSLPLVLNNEERLLGDYHIVNHIDALSSILPTMKIIIKENQITVNELHIDDVKLNKDKLITMVRFNNSSEILDN